MTDPTADAAKLLPCPCCGGKAEFSKIGGGGIIVECVSCELSTTAHDFSHEAQSRWNARYPSVLELLEACKGLSEILGVFLAPDDSDWQKVINLRAAIAKIEGQKT